MGLVGVGTSTKAALKRRRTACSGFSQRENANFKVKNARVVLQAALRRESGMQSIIQTSTPDGTMNPCSIHGMMKATLAIANTHILARRGKIARGIASVLNN